MTLAEFKKKYYNLIPYELTLEKDYIEDCYKLYEDTGFTDTFNTPYEQYKEYNGLRFNVIRRGNVEDGIDRECMPMWYIELENGIRIFAWAEEITLIENI